ncbi:MAG: DUF5666 domain-containing protein [Terriglobales bacterium]
MVTVLVSSAANDQLSRFGITFSDLSLTSQSGKTVSLFAKSQSPEFIHVNASAEPVITLSVPQDIYTAASATISYSTFSCVSLNSSGGVQTSEFGSNGTQTATVKLASPITVTGTAMGLSLVLQVSQSATYSNCELEGATYSISPMFNLSAATVSSQPTNVENGKVSGVKGLISSVSTSGDYFGLATADGAMLSLNTSGSTVYEGIPGFSALAAGMPVDTDGTIQPDGSLLATRVAVEDKDTTSLSVLSGPLLNVAASEPTLLIFGREGQGYLFGSIQNGIPLYSSFGSAVFQTSGQFTNLQNLPFAAIFKASNMVPGQNVYISSHAPGFAGGPTYVPAATITLMPQTINGTVAAVSNHGGFATYAVSLAPYDLIPALAVQQGQTSLLKDASSVVVYVDSNTQVLSTKPLAAGSVLRFNGLLFNDNGILRMDCAQVNDGVAE